MNPTAWMGGSRPHPLSELSQDEREYASYLFRQQMRTWSTYWFAPVPGDIARIFWKRARYDAHATYRNEGESHV
jgi:hypothetical protein